MSTCVRVPSWGAALAAVLTAFVLLALAPAASLAQTGQIRGQVTSERDGDYLPGAQVVLEGTSLGAATDRNGRYRIDGVPEGDYTLVVSYLGYEEFRGEISVADNRIETQDASLAPSFVQAEGITVQLRQGQAKALSLQRTAPTIVNIVDEEQIQLFPDHNTAEVLQRVPGVNISRSQGEGKFIFLRGTEPRLTSVTVNGEKLATPEDEERFVALDVISANQLASLEVTKALTPDMDADAIGGTVDLITRSPFDQAGGARYFQLTGGAGYGDLGGEPQYQTTLAFSDVFADQKVGLSINGNYQRLNRITHNSEFQWDDVETIDEVEIPFALTEMQLRHFLNERDRYGLSADMEFRPSESSTYYVRGMFNKRDDFQSRQENRVRVDRGEYESATVVREAQTIRNSQDRVETQVISNVAAGGDHHLSSWLVDYTLAYTYGEQNKDDGQIIPEFEFNQDVDLELDLSSPDTPQVNFTNIDESALSDPANFNLVEVDYREEFTSDKETIAALNLEYPYSIGDNSASLKFGTKARFKKKDRDDQRSTFEWNGDQDVTMAEFATDEVDEEFLDGAYIFGPTVDNDAIRRFLDQNRSSFEEATRIEDSIGDAYEASEDVYAYYAMTTMQLDRLMLLGGLRHEFTTTDYSGTVLTFDDEGEFVSAVQAADDRSYNNLFPMFHARYGVSDRTNLRFAFTSGLARANFFDLIPYVWIFPEDEEIERGNANLDPTYAYNFDLLAEHYFQGIGVLSGGVFYKDLSDVIYDRTFTETQGPFTGFEVVEAVNGGDANLFGVELNWQQQFTFLPGFWSGFGIYGNYTHTESEADLLFREWTTLPGQASDSGNLALTYEGYGLDARISMNYNGKFIDEVGDSPDRDQIIDDHVQWDFSANYNLTPHLGLYLNAINLNDEPRRDYLGTTNRPIQRELYSWWTTFGARFTPW